MIYIYQEQKYLKILLHDQFSLHDPSSNFPMQKLSSQLITMTHICLPLNFTPSWRFLAAWCTGTISRMFGGLKYYFGDPDAGLGLAKLMKQISLSLSRWLWLLWKLSKLLATGELISLAHTHLPPMKICEEAHIISHLPILFHICPFKVYIYINIYI